MDLDHDIDQAVEGGILERTEGKISLTPGGREMAEHMQEMIPLFFETILSPKTVSIVTIVAHVILSVLKLVFGFISQSTGLISDEIDNTVDTISSVLVWVGIRFDREKLVSLFVIGMMFVSVVGIGIMSVKKLIQPNPIRIEIAVFIVSGLCGLIMLLISSYQYFVGRRHANFAIICQSVDSKNHFLTSVLVCIGIVLSYLAQRLNANWLFYGDATASVVIGLMILRSTIELTTEFFKSEEKGLRISHFIGKAEEKLKMKIVYEWLSITLRDTSRTKDDLKARFEQEFCKDVPKILLLSGIGYRPQSSTDVDRYLDYWIQRKKIVFTDGKYKLSEKGHGKPKI